MPQELKDLCIYVAEILPKLGECQCKVITSHFEKILSTNNCGNNEALDWEHIQGVKQSTGTLPSILDEDTAAVSDTITPFNIWKWIMSFFRLNCF